MERNFPDGTAGLDAWKKFKEQLEEVSGLEEEERKKRSEVWSYINSHLIPTVISIYKNLEAFRAGILEIRALIIQALEMRLSDKEKLLLGREFPRRGNSVRFLALSPADKEDARSRAKLNQKVSNRTGKLMKRITKSAEHAYKKEKFDCWPQFKRR